MRSATISGGFSSRTGSMLWTVSRGSSGRSVFIVSYYKIYTFLNWLSILADHMADIPSGESPLRYEKQRRQDCESRGRNLADSLADARPGCHRCPEARGRERRFCGSFFLKLFLPAQIWL